MCVHYSTARVSIHIISEYTVTKQMRIFTFGQETQTYTIRS